MLLFDFLQKAFDRCVYTITRKQQSTVKYQFDALRYVKKFYDKSKIKEESID